MEVRIILSLILVFLFSKQCLANDCDATLKLETLRDQSSYLKDWRVAKYVTEQEYNESKVGVGVDGAIADIPVGASYDEFKKNYQTREDRYQESLTIRESKDIYWTGFSDNGMKMYIACLQQQRANQPGLHLSIRGATASSYLLQIVWNQPGYLDTDVRFSASSVLPELKDGKFSQGTTNVTVQRPKEETILSATANGLSTEEIYLLPAARPLPKAPCIIQSDEKKCQKCYENVGSSSGYTDQLRSFVCPNMIQSSSGYIAKARGQVTIGGSGQQVKLSIRGPQSIVNSPLICNDPVNKTCSFDLSTQPEKSDSGDVMGSIFYDRCFSSGGEVPCQVSGLEWQVCTTSTGCNW